MRLADLLRMAFSNLLRRKLRTSLTILAIVIGATLVALMVSLGNGLQEFIVNQFGLMVPQDALMVSSGEISFGGRDRSPHEITSIETVIPQPFTQKDLDSIRAIPGVARVDFSISVRAFHISPEDSDKAYTVSASTAPDYQVSMRRLVAGSHFAEEATSECLISHDYLETFAWPDGEAALGKRVTLTIGKQNPYVQETTEYTFTVVGVIERTLNAAEVLIPIDDAKEMARYYRDDPKLYTDEQPGSILQVKAMDESLIDPIAADIEELGFSAITPNEILAEIDKVFSIIQIALSTFGIIALVVAAIGIINTLMMAVYERTREIGVMKAVGATKGAVRLLFTAEGGALGFMGGIVGSGTAWILGQLLNTIGARTFLSDFPTFKMSVFPPWLIFGVIGLTTAISLLAGLYPASRAARLDPVDALRYE